MKLYHLTRPENVEAVKRDGIKADDEGAIYLFTDLIVANTIARDQLFMERYSVFKVTRRGITGTCEDDNVAEFTRAFHVRLIQPKGIAAKHLRWLGDRKTIFHRPTDWDYWKNERLGLPPEYTNAEFDLRRWMDEQREAGVSNDDPAYKAESDRRMAELNRIIQEANAERESADT